MPGAGIFTCILVCAALKARWPRRVSGRRNWI